MITTVSPSDIRPARAPHELFMVNLLLFHLLAAPAAIALEVGLWGLLLPLVLSLTTMAYSRYRASVTEGFIGAHWRLALGRYRWLLVAYAIAAVLIGIGTLVGSGSSDSNMSGIIQTVFVRIAIMPVLLTVMVCAYLESNAIKQAASGEWPGQKPATDESDVER